VREVRPVWPLAWRVGGKKTVALNRGGRAT
jgi:hypothetical protein